MSDRIGKLLVVDDEPSIRMSLSRVLNDIGYQVRTAENGLSALIEIRSEIPDLLLTDLNMPGMSGFALIGVVRRRFPAIPVIAMSGAFFGNEVPSGVNADAFYPKGGDVRSLVRIIESLTPPKRMLPSTFPPDVPVVIQRNGHDASGEAYVTITCPECLRSFSQPAGGSVSAVRKANCIHCRKSIPYTIAEPADYTPAKTPWSTPPRRKQDNRSPSTGEN